VQTVLIAVLLEVLLEGGTLSRRTVNVLNTADTMWVQSRYAVWILGTGYSTRVPGVSLEACRLGHVCACWRAKRD